MLIQTVGLLVIVLEVSTIMLAMFELKMYNETIQYPQRDKKIIFQKHTELICGKMDYERGRMLLSKCATCPPLLYFS